MRRDLFKLKEARAGDDECLAVMGHAAEDPARCATGVAGRRTRRHAAARDRGGARTSTLASAHLPAH